MISLAIPYYKQLEKVGDEFKDILLALFTWRYPLQTAKPLSRGG